MEKISIAMGASTIELSEAGLRITILRSFWSPKQWQRLVSLLSQVVTVGWSWINRPRPG
jgi:hypothetical protein